MEGKGRISIRDLVVNALRMRPDRIIVGEVRSDETLDMLQAMNTGHDGSLTTIHANSPRDSISRIETMVMMSGSELPSKAIRDQVASAINLIVQQARLRDGSRKITSVSEIVGMEGDVIRMQEIFKYDTEGEIDAEGRFKGHFKATGIVPKCIEKIRENGVAVNNDWFKN
jgi:pilus assembly protein CpaF